MGREDRLEAKDAAIAAAREVYAQHWGNRGLPVDPVQIAESMGVEVYQKPIPGSDICGALRKHRGGRAQIFIEATDPPNRRRFTCAHELGHYWRARGDDTIERIDYRSGLSSTGSDVEEVFANNFAAELLMPEDLVRGIWSDLGGQSAGTRRSVMAQTFEVSTAALDVRLRALSIV